MQANIFYSFGTERYQKLIKFSKHTSEVFIQVNNSIVKSLKFYGKTKLFNATFIFSWAAYMTKTSKS